MEQPRLRVAICGGGIIGLTLANLLKSYPDIDYQIYEGARKFEEIGAGLGLWTRSLAVLDEAGLTEEYMKIGTFAPDHNPDLVFEMRNGGSSSGNMFGKWEMSRGAAMFHRARLLDLLVKEVPQHRTHFQKRLVSYHQSRENIRINFMDGSSAECDVLVGSDGIKSAVRASMYGLMASREGRPELTEHIHPKWTGTFGYRSLTQREKIEAVAPDHPVLRCAQMYAGNGKHLIALPMQGGNVINMLAVTADYNRENKILREEWVKFVPHEELLEAFRDFEDENAKILLKLMTNPSKWAIHWLGKPLPFFVRGRVALIGDAAHAMPPHLAIGAGMGLEDARVLARFLGKSEINATNVQYALRAYNKARVATTGRVMLRSRNQGMAYDFSREFGEDERKTVDYIKANVSAVLNLNIENDIREGLQWIKQELSRLSSKV